MKKIFILVAISISLFGAGIIEVSQTQQQDLGIKLQKTIAMDSIMVGPYNGTVVLDKKDIISIGSSLDAVVKDIYVKNYEHVKKGQKLLSISSSELLSLQESYIKSLIESENVDKNHLRNKALLEKGIISHKKFLESLKQKQSIDLRVKLNANKLLTSGFSTVMLKKVQENHQPIVKLNILAHKDGVINTIDVNIGQKVESNRSMMMIYADGDRYIELSVALKSITDLSIGDICEFESYTAKITAIGRVVNTKSQSVQVRAKIQDPKDIMINRIYQVNIKKDIVGALKIKKSALVYQDNKSYVFKKVNNGFEVVEVEVIKEGPVCYIVKSELKKGDELAVSSTSALLSAMDSTDE
jgi:multidrug efflux pump subunit AcrA (membrane-fusion protein)